MEAPGNGLLLFLKDSENRCVREPFLSFEQATTQKRLN